MGVCTRRLDWREHPPHDGDSCSCAPELPRQEQQRYEKVRQAEMALEAELKHFTVGDLTQLIAKLMEKIDDVAAWQKVAAA